MLSESSVDGQRLERKVGTMNLIPLFIWLGSLALPTMNLGTLMPGSERVAGFWLAATSFAPMFWTTDPIVFLGGAIPNALLLVGTVLIFMQKRRLAAVFGIAATLGAIWAGVALKSNGLLIGYWAWLASCLALVALAVWSASRDSAKVKAGQ